MSNTFNEKLDEAMYQIRVDQTSGHIPMIDQNSLEVAKKAIRSLILEEVVGKNEPVQYVDDEPATELDDYAETRNDWDKQRSIVQGDKQP